MSQGTFVVAESTTIGDDSGVARVIALDSQGRQRTVIEPATPPVATIPVNLSFVDSSNAIIDEVFVITNGTTLVIQSVNSGAAGNGAICATYVADDGVNPNDLTAPITNAYNLPGNNTQSPNFPVIGDGTRAIILRRTPSGAGGAREMFIELSGFES